MEYIWSDYIRTEKLILRPIIPELVLPLVLYIT